MIIQDFLFKHKPFFMGIYRMNKGTLSRHKNSEDSLRQFHALRFAGEQDDHRSQEIQDT